MGPCIKCRQEVTSFQGTQYIHCRTTFSATFQPCSLSRIPPPLKLDRPQSAKCDCLLNIFAAGFHILSPLPPSTKWRLSCGGENGLISNLQKVTRQGIYMHQFCLRAKIAMGYDVDGRSSIIGRGRCFLLLIIQNGCENQPCSHPMGTMILSLGVKRPGLEAHQ